MISCGVDLFMFLFTFNTFTVWCSQDVIVVTQYVKRNDLPPECHYAFKRKTYDKYFKIWRCTVF